MTRPAAGFTPQQQFGQNVRCLRLQSGLTHDVLAQRCNRFKRQLAQIEEGTVMPTLTMIVVLASALEVAPHELLVGISISMDREQAPG
jgi:transcriptional regulator with XRE-family HTH domain